MIPSMTMAPFIHGGSVHDESTTFIVFVGATALEPPIHRSLVADADIGLGPPTYHSRPLKWWGFIVRDLLFDDGGDINTDYKPYKVGVCEQSGSSFAHVIDFSSSDNITFFSLPPTLLHRRWHFN
jgi:hypothetical protein